MIAQGKMLETMAVNDLNRRRNISGICGSGKICAGGKL